MRIIATAISDNRALGKIKTKKSVPAPGFGSQAGMVDDHENTTCRR